MTNEPPPRIAADFLDDSRHFQQVLETLDQDPRFNRMTAAISLLGDGLGLVPLAEWSNVYANDLSAFACLIRSYRALRAASNLLLFGYYGEVRCILRSVYESAALSRMLAKEPELAEKWLRKEKWFPDREVRAWFGEVTASSREEAQEATESYAKAYRQMSAWAHPTAISCLPLIRPDVNDDTKPGLRLTTSFDQGAMESLIGEMTLTALFGCFAFRNSLANERAIDPRWRESLYDLAQQVSGTEMPHLARDWEKEQSYYEALKQKVQEVSSLSEHLQKSPSSWDNLNKSSSS
jgi:hypothetical protein